MIPGAALDSFIRRMACTLAGCLAVLLLAVPPSDATHLAEEAERRLNIGLSLFPNIVSIDLDLERKLNGSGSLLLFVVYEEQQALAEELRGRLSSQVETIHGQPVVVKALAASQAAESMRAQPCGIFLAENVGGAPLHSLIDYANKKQCILFSPFANAMDKGVMVGLQVTSRVQPAVHLTSLRKAMVRLHKLFLQSAVRYE